MTRLLLPLLALVAGCTANPGDPEELELVRVSTPPEAPPPRVWRVALEGGIECTSEAPLELWLPLPVADAEQSTSALVVEVFPPGDVEVEPVPGGRAVHAHGPAPRLRAGWRATVLQTPPHPPPAGPVSPGIRLGEPRAHAIVDGRDVPVVTKLTCDRLE